MTSISPAGSIAAYTLDMARARLAAPQTRAPSETEAAGAASDAAAPVRPRTSIRPVVADHASPANSAKVDLRMVQPGYFVAYAEASASADKAGAGEPDADARAEAGDQAEAQRQFNANLQAVETNIPRQGSSLKVDI
jgi:hypothetical protein